MEVNREVRWSQAVSSALYKVAPLEMVIQLQALGRLDAQLIADDQHFCDPNSKSDGFAFNDHLLPSYLWVLGAYEVIRTLYERCKERPELREDHRTRLREIRDRFTRLRIPLAKFEAAKAHQDTDFSLAWPALHPTLGIAWKVAQGIYISRRELSDAFLELLEAIVPTQTESQ
jgi:hypothetical protein